MYIQLPNITALLPNELLLLYCFSCGCLSSLYMAPPLLIRYKKCLHSFLNDFWNLAHGHVVVPAVLLCGFHKHLFYWAKLRTIFSSSFSLHTKQLSYNTIFLSWQCLAPCWSYRTSHATGKSSIVGQARLFINLVVWTTFTGRPSRICPPTALPADTPARLDRPLLHPDGTLAVVTKQTMLTWPLCACAAREQTIPDTSAHSNERKCNILCFILFLLTIIRHYCALVLP